MHVSLTACFFSARYGTLEQLLNHHDAASCHRAPSPRKKNIAVLGQRPRRHVWHRCREGRRHYLKPNAD